MEIGAYSIYNMVWKAGMEHKQTLWYATWTKNKDVGTYIGTWHAMRMKMMGLVHEMKTYAKSSDNKVC